MLVLEHRENVMGKKDRSHFSRFAARASTKQLPGLAEARRVHLAARVQARRVSLALLLGFFGAGRKGCVGERFLRKARNELGGIFRTLN